MKTLCYVIFLINALILLSSASRAQDERYFRDLLSGDFFKDKKIEATKPRFRAFAPLYELDLTGDYRPERLMFELRDGQDWVSLYSDQKKPIFRYQLGPTGAESQVYRLRKIDVSDEIKALVLYYFEGANRYLGVQSYARVHILTYRPNNLSKTIKAFKGPVFWEEFHDGKDHYRRRKYDIEFADLNNDGTKEMLLKLNNVTRIYSLQDSGEWKNL